MSVPATKATWRGAWPPVVAMLVAGVLAGAAWSYAATPATLEARDGQLLLSELASTDVFAVVALFTAIGVVVSLVWGIYLGGRAPALGWPLVFVAIVVAFVAAVLAWRVGVWLGPPDPSTVSGLRDGASVSKPLEVDALAPFIAWPIAAVVGLLGRVYMAPSPPPR